MSTKSKIDAEDVIGNGDVFFHPKDCSATKYMLSSMERCYEETVVKSDNDGGISERNIPLSSGKLFLSTSPNQEPPEHIGIVEEEYKREPASLRTDTVNEIANFKFAISGNTYLSTSNKILTTGSEGGNEG